MAEHQLMSEKIDVIALALGRAQAEIEGVNKDKQGYGYKYADLGACLQAIKKPLRDNGLSISQLGICDENNKQMLVTLLMHESGQWLKSIFCIESVELKQCNSLQNLGAGLTYMRRYALCAIVGLTQEDDDAQSLTKPSKNKSEDRNTASQSSFVKLTMDNLEGPPAITQSPSMAIESSVANVAAEVRCLLSEGKGKEAYSLCESLNVTNKKKLWSLLDPEERSALKRIKEAA
jgi:hypothetical protein